MKQRKSHSKHSLSLTLSLGILGFVTAVFFASVGFLYERSLKIVKQEAIEHATHMLENTELNIRRYLDEAEAATESFDQLVLQHPQPDSLKQYTQRLVELNPNINGCSITMEPDFFPHLGKPFSVYSLREGDRVTTEIEGEYDYYEKEWYKKPKEMGKACRTDPYNDFNEGSLSSPTPIVSYGKPLYDEKDSIIGIISTDISITWISKAILELKPYPNAYGIMVGADGCYFVHPDRTKTITTNILSSADNKQAKAVSELGQEMLDGKKGHKSMNVKGKKSIVFYQPVEGTEWSIALVCPEKEMMAAFQKVVLFLIPILFVGLLLMAVVCWRIISHFIEPLDLLAVQSSDVAKGHFDQKIASSKRIDAVGNLQNSFKVMLETINQYIADIKKVNNEAERSNEQLATAHKLSLEADRRKEDFIKEVSLQIRTPLNIVAGFLQVLEAPTDGSINEEQKTSLDAIKQNATTARRMAHMLFDVSWKGERVMYDRTKSVEVNAVIEASIKDFNERQPHNMRLHHMFNIPDPLYLHTNQLYLHRILRELLINAKKFAPGSIVTFTANIKADMVRFVIQDTGPGIPIDESERVFEPFVKLDNFSEGLGIGLGLTRQHVINLGGSMTLDTSYTDGTRFIIDIPNE